MCRSFEGSPIQSGASGHHRDLPGEYQPTPAQAPNFKLKHDSKLSYGAPSSSGGLMVNERHTPKLHGLNESDCQVAVLVICCMLTPHGVGWNPASSSEGGGTSLNYHGGPLLPKGSKSWQVSPGENPQGKCGQTTGGQRSRISCNLRICLVPQSLGRPQTCSSCRRAPVKIKFRIKS